jgi:hypothetical protein
MWTSFAITKGDNISTITRLSEVVYETIVASDTPLTSHASPRCTCFRCVVPWPWNRRMSPCPREAKCVMLIFTQMWPPITSLRRPYRTATPNLCHTALVSGSV